MKRKNFEARVDVKRAEAKERTEARSKRTPQQQLDLLDQRLGKGVGAQKERAKLTKLIEQGA